jgi:hypothetical protein
LCILQIVFKSDFAGEYIIASRAVDMFSDVSLKDYFPESDFGTIGTFSASNLLEGAF